MTKTRVEPPTLGLLARTLSIRPHTDRQTDKKSQREVREWGEKRKRGGREGGGRGGQERVTGSRQRGGSRERQLERK